MALINASDLKFGTSHTIVANITSTLCVTWIVIALSFPIIIAMLYAIKIKRRRPLPDLRDNMTIE